MNKIITILTVFTLLLSCSGELNQRYKIGKKLSKSTEKEDWEKAIEEFDEVISMKVDAREYQANIYRKLGKRHMEYEQWNDSLKYYKQAIEILPNEGILHYRIGLCLSQLSRSESDEDEKITLIDEAVKEYKIAIDLNKKLIDPYYGLGIIYFYIYKEYKKGTEYMAEVLKRDPRNIDGHVALGRFYYDRGDLAYRMDKFGHAWRDFFSKSLEFYNALITLMPETDERYGKVKENIQRIRSELEGMS